MVVLEYVPDIVRGIVENLTKQNLGIMMLTEFVWHYEHKWTYNYSLTTDYEQEMLHDTRGRII